MISSNKGDNVISQRAGLRHLKTVSFDREVTARPTGSTFRLNLIDFKKKRERGIMAYNECMCHLTDVYYLCEIADSLIMDSLAIFNKESWFKNEIKFNFKNALKKIRYKIKIFKSQNNQVDVIEDFSDSVYDEVKGDLQKLMYGTELELTQQGIEQAKTLASLLCVKIILNLATLQYRQIVGYMHENVLHIDYDKNFKYADCSDVEFYWHRGTDCFIKEYIHKEIDPSKLSALVNGGRAFVHFFDKARKEVDNAE